MMNSQDKQEENLTIKASDLINEPDEQHDDTGAEGDLGEDGVYFDPTDSSVILNLLRGTIQAYENAANQHNTKQEITFGMTISIHKVPTDDGNKNVAYCRLERVARDKGTNDVGTPTLVHQEMYVFRDMKERLMNKSYADQLYLNMLARLVGAGLEYAEFLRRSKAMMAAQKAAETPKDEVAERLGKIGLVKADSSEIKNDAPIDQEYVDYIKNERAKEGL